MIVRALAAAAIGLVLPAAVAMAQAAPPQEHGAGPGDRDHGPHGGPGGPGGGGHGPQIFLSPAGEPFRAPAGAPYPVAAWFAQADADHDGALTLAEFSADFARFFERVDANHDAIIDGFEVGDYEKTIAPEVMPRMYREEAEDEGGQGDDHGGMERGGPPGGGGGSHRRGGGGGPPGGGMAGPGRGGGGHRPGGAGAGVDGAAAYSLINLPEPVSGADADFDGKVTRAEWAQAAKTRFKLLDKNGDGKITLAELPLTRVQRLAAEPPKPQKRGLFGGGKPRPPSEM